MHKSFSLIIFLAFLSIAQAASALESDTLEINDGRTPIFTVVSVSFPGSGSVSNPTDSQAELPADAQYAAMVTINGRTSTDKASPKDEALALARAVSARAWLMDRGVSPLKIMLNYVSAADFVADNSTPEGRRENQRVEIELYFVPVL